MTIRDQQAKNPPPWRAIGWFLALYVAVWIATLVLGVGPNMVMRWLGASDALRLWLGGAMSRGGMLACTVLFSAWTLQWATGLRASELWFPREGRARDLLIGLALGGGVMGAILGIELVLGWLRIEGWALRGVALGDAMGRLWLALLTNTLAALGEEAMFRGYFLTSLRRTSGTWASLLIMSIPFAAAHLLIDGASETNAIVFTGLLMLPGLLLGWAYLRSGSLWLPVGLHFAWNLCQDNLLNLTAERGESLLGLVTARAGPDWFMGTSYGVEVGAAGVMAVAFAAVGVWFATRDRELAQEGQSP